MLRQTVEMLDAIEQNHHQVMSAIEVVFIFLTFAIKATEQDFNHTVVTSNIQEISRHTG